MHDTAACLPTFNCVCVWRVPVQTWSHLLQEVMHWIAPHITACVQCCVYMLKLLVVTTHFMVWSATTVLYPALSCGGIGGIQRWKLWGESLVKRMPLRLTHLPWAAPMPRDAHSSRISLWMLEGFTSQIADPQLRMSMRGEYTKTCMCRPRKWQVCY